MQVEDVDPPTTSSDNPNPKYTDTTHRILFLSISADFKFKQSVTFNSKRRLLLFHAQLCFNNGATVPLSISHNTLVYELLNDKNKGGDVIFSVDQNSQTLTCSAKLNNVKRYETIDKRIKMWEEEILFRKKAIIALLMLIGIPNDSEHTIMRKLLLEKKKLKNTLIQLLEKESQQQQETTSEMDVEQSQVVTYFGPDEEVQIVQAPSSSSKTKPIEGGYFSIETNQYLITQKDRQPQIKKLAKKTLRPKRKETDAVLKFNREKFAKELAIVNSIKDKTYLINYYCPPFQPDHPPDYILMDKYDCSLQQYIYYIGDTLLLSHKLILAKQIVDAVMSLHQSQVVHRDVKPSNFLVDDSTHNKNTFKLKIIDFAQSYSEATKFYKGDYACSHPYSPLQCSQKRGMLNDKPQEGLNRLQIDYWSVGVSIYELFFRRLPLSYSRAFLIDISTSWKTELLLAVDQRQKYGFHLVDDIITIICIKMLKFDQEKRMKLTITKRILIAVQIYIQNLLNFLFTFKPTKSK